MAVDDQVRAALVNAYDYAESIVRADGHFLGELKSNCTITAEYILLYQALGSDDVLSRNAPALQQYLLSEQNPDGSWSIAPGQPGNISTTVESYLALKLLGLSPDKSPALRQAQSWVTTVGGGVENVRVFTRMYLAQFGLFPWDAVPELPAELILMPSWAPINIYRLSSWARSTVVPLLVVNHHRPVFALPNGTDADNDFLDELWLNPNNKHVPYSGGFWDLVAKLNYFDLTFVAVDKAIKWLGGLRKRNPLRQFALHECLQWIISRQEREGDWAGIFPPMHVGVLAYVLSGYKLDDAPVRLALEAIERFVWKDETGMRVQACVSPVWDTVLMASALSAADRFQDTRAVSLRKRGLDWVRRHQILGSEGDWRVYRPYNTPGGFSFEYFNRWYPDVDDTCAAIIAFLKDDPRSASSQHVLDAVKWVLGMQCMDGGWAAFDVENDRLWLNRIPFSDMDALCDPPTSDIVGRVLEAFGLLLLTAFQHKLYLDERIRPILDRVRRASGRGIQWLACTQQRDGSWYGRWGVNYLYGTSNALAGLAYFCCPESDDNMPPQSQHKGEMQSHHAMVKRAVAYLVSAQNPDGGWGESLNSYESTSQSEIGAVGIKTQHDPGVSTPSQTAWGLIGILPYLPTDHPAIVQGIRWLLEHQTERSLKSATLNKALLVSKGLTWDGKWYTGTGFPRHFYLGYTLYSHYFPMMALTEYSKYHLQEQSGARSGLLEEKQ